MRSGELRRNGTTVRLQPQPLKVLLLLAGRPGDVVTREEIQSEIWPAGTFVDFEQSLNFCIRQIRAALRRRRERPALRRDAAAARLPLGGRPGAVGVGARRRSESGRGRCPPEPAARPVDRARARRPRPRRPPPRPRAGRLAPSPRARPAGARLRARRVRGLRSRTPRRPRRRRRRSSASPSAAGPVNSARFGPDGQVVYSAAWDGGGRAPPRRALRPAGLERASRSRTRWSWASRRPGEVAFLREGVLARAPLAGRAAEGHAEATSWPRTGAPRRPRLRGGARRKDSRSGSSSPRAASCRRAPRASAACGSRPTDATWRSPSTPS